MDQRASSVTCRSPQFTAMQLSRAVALIALILIVVLSAGYAAAERTGQDPGISGTPSQETRP